MSNSPNESSNSPNESSNSPNESSNYMQLLISEQSKLQACKAEILHELDIIQQALNGEIEYDSDNVD